MESLGLLQVLLIAAVIIWRIARLFGGVPLRGRPTVISLALVVWGASMLGGHLSGVDVGLITVEVALGVLTGIGRGLTVMIYPRDGQLWQRYRPVTLGIWVLAIGLRLAAAAVGQALGGQLRYGSMMLVVFGVSLLVEALVVARRGAALGVPFAAAAGSTRQ